MSDLTKSFSDAFAKASRRSGTFGDNHKKQMDVLKDFAAKLTAEGVFEAKVDSIGPGNIHPVLDIREKSTGNGAAFFIEFGQAAFSGGASVKLSMGLNRAPVGDKSSNEGYELEYENDRNACFAAIGAALAQRCKSWEMGAAALAYVGVKQKGFAP